MKNRKRLFLILGCLCAIPVVWITLTKASRLFHHAPNLWTQGNEAYRKGNYDFAILCFTKILRNNPNNKIKAEIYVVRSAAYREKGEYDKAFQDCNHAIYLEPTFTYAYENRADTYQKIAEYDEAIADYNRTIASAPNNSIAYCNRGCSYEKKGDYDQALLDCNKAILLSPKLADTYYVRGDVYRAKGQDDKAIEDYDQGIRLKPNIIGAYYTRGNAYYRKGEYDKAIADFNQEILLNPKAAGAYNNRGVAYEAKGEYDKAIADFNETILLNPKLPGGYDSRGYAYERRCEYDKAIADFNQSILLNPKLPTGYNHLAWLLATCSQASVRDGKKSVQYALQACELSHWKVPACVDTLAVAYAECGDFLQAIKYEQLCLTSSSISNTDAAEERIRLALFAGHKPYHETDKSKNDCTSSVMGR